MDLCNPREVRALLERYGLAPQKGFGQNFLINPDIPERIAESSYNAVRSCPCAALEVCYALNITPAVVKRLVEPVCGVRGVALPEL